MTKVKLAERVKGNCIKDREGNPCYCSIYIITDKELIDNEVFTELCKKFSNNKLDDYYGRYLTISDVKVPPDVELAVEDDKLPTGEKSSEAYKVISWENMGSYQEPLLEQIPCFVRKDFWEVI